MGYPKAGPRFKNRTCHVEHGWAEPYTSIRIRRNYGSTTQPNLNSLCSEQLVTQIGNSMNKNYSVLDQYNYPTECSSKVIQNVGQPAQSRNSSHESK